MRTRSALTGAGKGIYFTVVALSFVLDIAIFVGLLRHALSSGDYGGFLVYVLIGTWAVLLLGHWLGMLIAAPFVAAGSATTPPMWVLRIRLARKRARERRSH